MTDLTTLQTEHAAVRKEIEDISKNINERVAAFKKQLEDETREERNVLYRRSSDLSMQIEKLKEAAVVAHPLEGRKVFIVEDIYNRWSSRPKGKKTTYGVIETVRGDTRFAENISSWRHPSRGEVIVRHLKKDGTIGLKHGSFGNHWKLVEEENAA